VLVLPAPTVAYDAAEAAAIGRWVRDGGGLFVITDSTTRSALTPLGRLADLSGPPAPPPADLLDGPFGRVLTAPAPGTLVGRHVGAGRVVVWSGRDAVQDGTGCPDETGPATTAGTNRAPATTRSP
jgi:hypothetical protein